MPSIKEIFDTMEYSPAPESDNAAQAWLEEHGRKFDLFIENKWQAPEANYLEVIAPATGKKISRSRGCELQPMLIKLSKLPVKPSKHGARHPVTNAPVISMRLPAIFRSTPGSSRWSNHWIMASPSVNRGILTFPWSPVIFIIMRAGRNSWKAKWQIISLSESSGRSSPGISRY